MYGAGHMAPPHMSGAFPPMMPPSGLFQPPLNMRGIPQAMSMDDAPGGKRPRMEEQLEPEDQWLRKVQGPISLYVVMPNTTDYALNEKHSFTVSLDITSQVTALKSLIAERTEVPPSKQKLVYENHFIKDTNSLAYYNMANHGRIQLQLKERGGKKK
jgi:splicing factor 3A subunit 1